MDCEIPRHVILTDDLVLHHDYSSNGMFHIMLGGFHIMIPGFILSVLVFILCFLGFILCLVQFGK